MDPPPSGSSWFCWPVAIFGLTTAAEVSASRRAFLCSTWKAVRLLLVVAGPPWRRTGLAIWPAALRIGILCAATLSRRRSAGMN